MNEKTIAMRDFRGYKFRIVSSLLDDGSHMVEQRSLEWRDVPPWWHTDESYEEETGRTMPKSIVKWAAKYDARVAP